MSPQGVYPAGDVCAIGDEISSTGEGRHITLYADNLEHGSQVSYVTKGYPVWWGDHAVGVAFTTQAAGVNPLIAVDTEGIWCLDVNAADEGGNVAVVPGDILYVNETTGAISKIAGPELYGSENSRPFGYALGNVGSGDTDRIAVKVHWMKKSPIKDEEVLYFGDGKDVAMYYTGTQFNIITGQGAGDELVYLSGALTVTGILTGNSNLAIGGAAAINQGLTVGGIFQSGNTTDATNSVTGSIITPGGVGIKKNLYVGDNIGIGDAGEVGSVMTWHAGNFTITHTDATLTFSGACWINGVLTGASNLSVGGTSTLNGTVQCNGNLVAGGSVTSGSMVCNGNFNAGGTISGAGAIVANGALSCGGQLTVASLLHITNPPIADPSVAGQVWDNAGVLTRSHG